MTLNIKHFWLKRKWVETLFFMLFIISVLAYSHCFTQNNTLAASQSKTFKVGLRIIDFDYKFPDGKKEVVTVAVWYPTSKNPRSFTYYRNTAEGKIQSKVALNGPIVTQSGPYPLILFVHGGFGTGYNGAYFAEYLASHGYVVVGPDYVDTKPPDYTQQIAFNRIKGGNVGRPLAVLMAAGRFAKDMSQDRDFFLAYLAEHRLNHTSFVLDKMIELNRASNSNFYQMIKEEAIGIYGHSEGGLTVLGKIGAYPDETFKDNRIKAALIFSAPGYPFEGTAQNIRVPVMFMAGDNDQPGLHPEIPRRIIYEKTNPPKFYLILKNATHFTFGNKGCGSESLYQAVNNNPQINTVVRYGLAFFEKYLQGNISAAEQLNKSDSAWAYYIKEETPGSSQEWGQEPLPGTGGPGGIREELKRPLERLRNLRGGSNEDSGSRAGILRNLLKKLLNR